MLAETQDMERSINVPDVHFSPAQPFQPRSGRPWGVSNVESWSRAPSRRAHMGVGAAGAARRWRTCRTCNNDPLHLGPFSEELEDLAVPVTDRQSLAMYKGRGRRRTDDGIQPDTRTQANGVGRGNQSDV